MKTYRRLALALHQIAMMKTYRRLNPQQKTFSCRAIEAGEKLIDSIMATAPRGIDCGTRPGIDSTEKRIEINFEYPHRNDVGMYTHSTRHCAVITSSLVFDYDLRITKNGVIGDDLIDYLYKVFDCWLSSEYPGVV
jgi:hypothetical protein